jgi:hypothetical protein
MSIPQYQFYEERASCILVPSLGIQQITYARSIQYTIYSVDQSLSLLASLIIESEEDRAGGPSASLRSL